MEVLDSLENPKRSLDKPLRIPISNIYKISGIGTVLTGRVESGVIKPGMIINFSPIGINAECKSIEMNNSAIT